MKPFKALLFCTMFIFSACKKDDIEHHKNNISCEINGESWTSCKPFCLFCFFGLYETEWYSEGGNYLYVIGRNFCKSDNSMEIFHIQFVGIESTTLEYERMNIRCDVDGHDYWIDTSYCCNFGTLTGFGDKPGAIRGGTFSGRMLCKDDGCSDTLMITGGVIDVFMQL